MTAQDTAHPNGSIQMKKICCSSCTTEMAFPSSAKYVKCPSCASIIDNQPLMQSQCIGCNSTLSHPTMAQYIRCPKCQSTMMSSGAVKRQKELEQREKHDQEKKKAATAAKAAAKEKEMAYCGTCSSLLSFPIGAKFILCPACKKTMNPQDHQQTDCLCCRTVLTHPSHSLYIQCPVCLQTQNAREKRRNAAASSKPSAPKAPLSKQKPALPPGSNIPVVPSISQAPSQSTTVSQQPQSQLPQQQQATAPGAPNVPPPSDPLPQSQPLPLQQVAPGAASSALESARAPSTSSMDQSCVPTFQSPTDVHSGAIAAVSSSDSRAASVPQSSEGTPAVPISIPVSAPASTPAFASASAPVSVSVSAAAVQSTTPKPPLSNIDGSQAEEGSQPKRQKTSSDVASSVLESAVVEGITETKEGAATTPPQISSA